MGVKVRKSKRARRRVFAYHIKSVRAFKLRNRSASHVQHVLRSNKTGKWHVISSGGRANSEGVDLVNERPSIAVRGSEGNERVYIEGTPFDVWEIIEAYKSLGFRGLLDGGNLSQSEIAFALRYYREHPDEIDRRIQANQLSEEEWRKLYPDVFAVG